MDHVAIVHPYKEGIEKEIGKGLTPGVPETMENIAGIAIFIKKYSKCSGISSDGVSGTVFS